MGREIYYLEAVVGADITSFRREMRDVRTDLAGLGTAFAAVQSAGRALTFGLTVPLATAGTAAVTAATQFDASMRNINSIALLSEGNFARLSDRVLTFGTDLRDGPTAAADALYAVFSAGWEDVSEAFQIMESGAALSEAGLTDLASTTETLTTTLMAYNATSDEAARYADIWTATVQFGVGTLDRFTNAMGRTNSFAAATGTSFESFAGSVAFLTQNSLTAANASTGMRNIFTKLLSPTDALSESFAELGVTGGTDLIETFGSFEAGMAALISTTDGSAESFANLWGSIQAKQAALVFFNNLPQYTQFMQDFNAGIEGTTEAARAQQLRSFAAGLELMKSAFQGVAIIIGSELLPILRPFVDHITEGLVLFMQADQWVHRTAIAFGVLGAALGPAIWLFGSLLSPIGLVTGAMIGLVRLVKNDFLGISTLMERAFSFADGASGGIVNNITTTMDEIWTALTDPPPQELRGPYEILGDEGHWLVPPDMGPDAERWAGTFGEALSRGWERLRPIIATMAVTLKWWFTDILFPALLETAGEGVTAVNSLFRNIFTNANAFNFGSFVGGIATSIVGMISSAWTYAGNLLASSSEFSFASLFGSFGTGVDNDALSSLGLSDFGANTAKTFFDSLVEGFSTGFDFDPRVLGDNILSLFGSFVTGIRNFADNGLGDLLINAGISGAINAAFGGLGIFLTAGNTIARALFGDEFVDNALKQLEGVVDRIGGRAIDVLTGIFSTSGGEDGRTPMYEAFRTLLQGDLFGAIDMVLPGVGTRIQEAFSNFGENVQEAFPKISGGISGLFSSMASWIISDGLPTVSRAAGYLIGRLGVGMGQLLARLPDMIFGGGDGGGGGFLSGVVDAVVSPFGQGFGDAMAETNLDGSSIFTQMFTGLAGAATLWVGANLLGTLVSSGFVAALTTGFSMAFGLIKFGLIASKFMIGMALAFGKTTAVASVGSAVVSSIGSSIAGAVGGGSGGGFLAGVAGVGISGVLAVAAAAVTTAFAAALVFDEDLRTTAQGHVRDFLNDVFGEETYEDINQGFEDAAVGVFHDLMGTLGIDSAESRRQAQAAGGELAGEVADGMSGELLDLFGSGSLSGFMNNMNMAQTPTNLMSQNPSGPISLPATMVYSQQPLDMPLIPITLHPDQQERFEGEFTELMQAAAIAMGVEHEGDQLITMDAGDMFAITYDPAADPNTSIWEQVSQAQATAYIEGIGTTLNNGSETVIAQTTESANEISSIWDRVLAEALPAQTARASDALLSFTNTGTANFDTLSTSVGAVSTSLSGLQGSWLDNISTTGSVMSVNNLLASVHNLSAAITSVGDINVGATMTGPNLDGQLAGGGPARAGGTYLVGEEGPEILTLGSHGGHVTPNHELGGGGTTVINHNNVNVTNQFSIDSMLQQLRRRGIDLERIAYNG